MIPDFIVHIKNKYYDGFVAFYPAVWVPKGFYKKGAFPHPSSNTIKGVQSFVLSATRGIDNLKAEWHGSELREGDATEKQRDVHFDTVNVPIDPNYPHGYTEEVEQAHSTTSYEPISESTIAQFIPQGSSYKFVDSAPRFSGISADGKEIFTTVYTSHYLDNNVPEDQGSFGHADQFLGNTDQYEQSFPSL